MPEKLIEQIDFNDLNQRAISKPLVTDIFTADPSAHVFENKIFIYPSHDVNGPAPFDDLGSHFAMVDYHVFSLEEPGGKVTDHGVVLQLKDVPWASQQMWAPDVAEKDGKYFLFFPAKDKEGIFRIGIAVSEHPKGPFKPEPEFIKGSFSIDPAIFKDDDDEYYMYFGGIWGGQLQRWRTGKYECREPESPTAWLPDNNEPALCGKVARLSTDMKQLAETPRDVIILDENGEPLIQGDNARRFFEASWVHKHNGKYYFSYSTGDTHLICYATGDNPYGPFTYRGVILNPVVGWTSHHSIVQFKNKWYLFYHDSSLSKGVTHLRCIKMTELKHRRDGSIETIEPYLLPE